MTTETRTLGRTANKWNAAEAAALSPLEALRYRSNLLGSDRAVSNYGGGNTSIKVREPDHLGREVDVLWVKGSGSDLGTMTEKDFTGLRLAEIMPLAQREEMTDEEMVAHLARCHIDPSMPRSSIETLFHAFVPFPHVDHTHADATNMIACAANGQELAQECFGDEVIWLPYVRPGFSLSKQMLKAFRQKPDARLVMLAKHGLVTWGETAEESYSRTIEAVNRAAAFVQEKARGKAAFGGQGTGPVDQAKGREIWASLLPTLRGSVSRLNRKIALVDM